MYSDMKRITYNTTVAVLGLACLTMMSCNDFLTLYPLDKVVEENFWEDKNDLEGVRYGAYSQMGSTIEKFIAWGDARSDAYKYNYENTYSSDYEDILEADPDSTMSIFDWGGVYTTINFCNKVLAHGEEVLAKDPQFTPTEWQQMKAEMVALRALNYFYLIRAFKDVPFTFEVINSDEDAHAFTNTSQMDILNTLIDDVTAVAGQGKSRFPSDKDTKGLMTNTAIYALLAEMHLWRGALREGRGFPEDQVQEDALKVIEYGQKSLGALALQNQQITNSSFDRSSNEKDDFGSGLTNALLIKNEDMQSDYNARSRSIEVNSYQSVFKKGNSDESIFELQFASSDYRESAFLRSLYGYSSDKHFILTVSNEAVKAALNGDATLYANDCRTWYSCVDAKYLDYGTSQSSSSGSSSYYYLTKWMASLFDMSTGNLTTDISQEYGSKSYHNWIFYRMTDVMLMMAEAYAITGEYETCDNIVDAIQKRSQLDQTTGLSKSGTSREKTKKACIDLVMRERLVELLGEGKRWFDLVRYAERIGGGTKADPREPEYMDGSEGVKAMVNDYMAKGYYSKLASNLVSRMQNRYGLYSPIYYRERSANYYLIPQNPVWNREKGDNNNQSDE